MSTALIGIFFSLLALGFWGFGDFYIQKTTRLIGSWKTTFYIGAIGSVLLFPFVVKELPQLSWSEIKLLFIFSFLTLIASILFFEALRKGKMAVIEPIVSLELPIVVALSVFLRGESLHMPQFLLMAIIFAGSLLITTFKQTQKTFSSPPQHAIQKRKVLYVLEKGIFLAVLGAFGAAGISFMIGVGSQDISPLVTLWFIETFLVVFTVSYFVLKGEGEWKNLWAEVRHHPRIILLQGILDNAAWLAYGIATTWVSISVAMTVSQGYIVLAVLLGLILNHEKITFLQKVGIGLSVGGILALSVLVADHFV